MVYNPPMPFPESIRRKEIERAVGCAVCKDPFPPGAYIEMHSATSLHLVLDKKSIDLRYIVTDPPLGHEILRGKSISAKVFKLGDTRKHDGFCLCPVCHDELKRVALAEARHRNPNFKGNAPPPQVIEEVTLTMIKRGRPIVYQNLI